MASTSGATAEQRKRAEKLIKEIQTCQRDYESAGNNRKTLKSQLTETSFVKREFDLLNSPSATPSTAKIYKRVGPILVPESAAQAQKTVNSRIEILTRQIAEQEDKMATLEEEISQKRALLQALPV